MPKCEQEELDKFLEEHKASGRICPSQSEFASSFFFIKKKDGSLRPVQDYRKLNKLTIRNRYLLPLISDLMDKLKGAKYFTKLDIRWGFNNVQIREGNEHKAAFITNRGLFEPLVMFFGLCNSPATFQTMMNNLFKELIDEGVVIVYMDDILIFTNNKEYHCQIKCRVLKILADNNLFLKPEKCEWIKDKIEYLGLLISEGSMSMCLEKVAAVQDWPTPTCRKHVQQFLGFTNFYCCFIKDFSKTATPLN